MVSGGHNNERKKRKHEKQECQPPFRDAYAQCRVLKLPAGKLFHLRMQERVAG